MIAVMLGCVGTCRHDAQTSAARFLQFLVFQDKDLLCFSLFWCRPGKTNNLHIMLGSAKLSQA